jgi:uncharacterized protein YfeS
VSDDSQWELAPDHAHPKAQRALTNTFFWSCIDDNTPFGNDNGADTLSFYREWRATHPSDAAIHFLTALLQGWSVTPTQWDVTAPEQIARLIAEDEFSFTHRDDVIIALAFGQIVLEGRVDADIIERALVALQRQATQPALDLWLESCHSERRRRLQLMTSILKQDWG